MLVGLSRSNGFQIKFHIGFITTEDIIVQVLPAWFTIESKCAKMWMTRLNIGDE